MTVHRAACIALAASLALVSGCAAKRPVLYPNVALQREGRQRAQADISACIAAAESAALVDEPGSPEAELAASGGPLAVFRWRDPKPLERQRVERCLTKQGYQVIDWQ